MLKSMSNMHFGGTGLMSEMAEREICGLGNSVSLIT